MEDYVSEISDFFLLKRAQGAFLPARDIMLIESWQEESIPLEVVLRGIEQTFSEAENGGKAEDVQTVRLCSENVLKAWEEYNGNLQLKPVEEEHIEQDDYASIYDEIEKFFSKVFSEAKQGSGRKNSFAEVLKAIRAKKEYFDSSGLLAIERESELKEEIEKEVFCVLSRGIPSEELKKYEDDIERNITKLKREVSSDTYKKTKESLMAQSVFSHFLLPDAAFWFLE